MRLVRYLDRGKVRVGALGADDLVRPFSGSGVCVSQHFSGPPEEIEGRSVGAVSLLAPITAGRFFCIGLNYQAHLAETARDSSERPSTFIRTAESLVGPDAPLWRPRASTHFDYEGELACVIGRAGRHIREPDALDHIFGYTCFLDGSVRDFQKHAVTAGKNFERSGAIGPWVVPAHEAPAWDAMTLTTRLNGETVQQTRTDLMIWGLPELIAYLSTVTTLQPGDVIATGTPSGVGARRDPPLWMRAGDRIEVEVEGVGRLRNEIIDEPVLTSNSVPAEETAA